MRTNADALCAVPVVMPVRGPVSLRSGQCSMPCEAEQDHLDIHGMVAVDDLSEYSIAAALPQILSHDATVLTNSRSLSAQFLSGLA